MGRAKSKIGGKINSNVSNSRVNPFASEKEFPVFENVVTNGVRPRGEQNS